MERKIQIAQVLAGIGVKGNNFIFGQVPLQKSPHLQGRHPITKINTQATIKELKDMMFLIVDKITTNHSLFMNQPKVLFWNGYIPSS
jgi:hypothetical protein